MGGNLSSIHQIWYFIGLAGFIFLGSWLFFAVMSYLHTYALIPEVRKGYTQIGKLENQE